MLKLYIYWRVFGQIPYPTDVWIFEWIVIFSPLTKWEGAKTGENKCNMGESSASDAGRDCMDPDTPLEMK